MNQTPTLVLESKEEQEFWDRAFLVALGKTNSQYNTYHQYQYYVPWSDIAASLEADRSILTRRHRNPCKPPVCGHSFGLGDSNLCVREKDHGGKCRAY